MDRQDVSRVQIIRGNALALPLADDSVDLVVTSPPYFGLRVMLARRKGRKTVRIADVVTEAEAAT